MFAGQVVGRRTDDAVHLGPWHIPMLSTCPVPQTRKCGCSGMPYLSDEIWAVVDLTDFLANIDVLEKALLESRVTINELVGQIQQLEQEQAHG